MEELLPSPRNMLYNAVLQGVSVEDVRQHRLLVISCATGKDHLKMFLALAPPELDDLLAWDYIEAEQGAPTGEQGSLTRILRRAGKPDPGGQTTVLGRTELLCQKDPATRVINAKVDYFITPLEMLRAELQARNPMRGLDEAEVRAGKIVRVSCALAEEANSLTWYARIPEESDFINAPSVATAGRIVKLRAGRPEIGWYGGIQGSMSRLTRDTEDKTASENWPIDLSTVVESLPDTAAAYTRTGIPYCGRDGKH